MQWNPNLWPSTDLPDQTMSVGWSQVVPGGEFTHRVTTTAQASEFAPSIVLRVLCHLLINCLPEEGLPEVYEGLTEFHEFYKNRTIHLLATAPIQKSIPVNVTGISTSQPFDVSED